MKKRMGLIESVDSKNKIVNLLGYGEFLGDFPKKFDDGFDVNTPKIKLDSGEEVWGSDVSYFSEASEIKQLITDYKNRGYTIKN